MGSQTEELEDDAVNKSRGKKMRRSLRLIRQIPLTRQRNVMIVVETMDDIVSDAIKDRYILRRHADIVVAPNGFKSVPKRSRVEALPVREGEGACRKNLDYVLVEFLPRSRVAGRRGHRLSSVDGESVECFDDDDVLECTSFEVIGWGSGVKPHVDEPVIRVEGFPEAFDGREGVPRHRQF
jgi:hypothetical protein